MQLVREQLGKVGITVDKDYWSIDRAYDRLVIVEVKGEFRTYISRKPVPAGVLLNNREYWIPFSSLKEELISNYNAWLNKVSAILGDEVFAEKTKEVIQKEQEREIDLLYARIEQIKSIFPKNIVLTFVLYDCAFDLSEKDDTYLINESLEGLYANIPGSINVINSKRYLYHTILNTVGHNIRVYFIILFNVNTSVSNLNIEDSIPIVPDENYYINASCITQGGYPVEQDNIIQIEDDIDVYMSVSASATFVIKAKKNG